MSSPRKFRVWYGEEMHDPPHEFTLSGSGHLLHDAEGMSRPVDGAPLFYTGSTNAEGVEVYEEDIILHDYADEPSVVLWSEYHAAFTLSDVQQDVVPIALEYGTILGNCYENPGLLKEPAA